MEAWYKKLGYYENPFLINPLIESTKWVGEESLLNSLVYYVQSGSMMFVRGDKGTGKTKLLRTIIKHFKGRVAYIDAAKLKKNLNIETVLKKKKGISGWFSKLPKNMILVIDNTQELTKVNIERLKYFFDQGYLQSVIFSGTKNTLAESLKNRIGKRVFEVPKVNTAQAIQIVQERLDDEESPISEEFIKTVFEKSNQNMRTFLINLHRVFEEMSFDDKETVEAAHLKVIDEKLDDDDYSELYKQLQIEVPVDTMTDGAGNKIMKIGEYYRVPAFEMFCGDCGAIVSEDDDSCPECGAEFDVQQEENDKGEAHA